jgi:GR25 family glycosyltransferase involved in LPS biosynthesis
MTAFEDFFDGRMFVINLSHRTDRLQHFQKMAAAAGLTCIQRFEGITGIIVDGRPNGNAGCTASHRALRDLQIANGWPRMFVFEDDAEIIYTDFHERWERFARELPPTWQMLYLGAGYGEPPIARVSPHVIRAGRLLTTSSYGVTLDMATRLAPHISGVGPIDSLYGGFHRENEVYLMSPRAVVQYPNHSDLQECESNNAMSMLDRALEVNL